MSKITITVAGTTCSGKSFIKYQIAKHLTELGLDINIVENELNENGVFNRLTKPDDFINSIKLKGVAIEVEEKQLARDLRKNKETYFIPKGT